MKYTEKIASIYIRDNENSAPALVISTNKFPINYSIPVSVYLFSLYIGKEYYMNTRIYNSDNELLMNVDTPPFILEKKNLSEDKLMTDTLYSSGFDLKTAQLNIFRSENFKIEISLLSSGMVLDTITTYFMSKKI
ncbi:hypothetical protein SY212_18080 [Ligilactobacillus agilis]|uniref:Uncharacterized protein n=1 Tax=Ligilactobacillus agilis TaxID=1601 RepID=A0A6F9XNM5_9LACO|nr:hypothetical protein [Ligilactobacillus agilis]GET06778.1 hypothetical protein SY212_18080 [Ligilactobacillus agilis]